MNKLLFIVLFGLVDLGAMACCSEVCAQENLGASPQGLWQGRWKSESTGHSGPMRVTITPTSQGTYQARFAGRFAAIIPFAYRAELIPQSTLDGQTILTSSKNSDPSWEATKCKPKSQVTFSPEGSKPPGIEVRS